MGNNFEELLAKSLKESRDYQAKQEQRKTAPQFKEVTVSEEERFLNSLSPEDREDFEKILIFDIGFVYYPGLYKNSSTSGFDPDWNRRYYEDKRFFLQTLKEKESSQSDSGRKIG